MGRYQVSTVQSERKKKDTEQRTTVTTMTVVSLTSWPNEINGWRKRYDDADESDYSLCREAHDGEYSIGGAVKGGFGLQGENLRGKV